MFNLGDGDKEKLEENMEEIKNLVSSSDDQQQEQQNQQPQQRQQQNNNQNPNPSVGDEEIPANKNNLENAFPGESEGTQQNQQEQHQQSQANQQVGQNNTGQAQNPANAQNQGNQSVEEALEDHVSTQDAAPNSNAGAVQNTTPENNPQPEAGEGLDDSLEGLKNEIQKQMQEKQDQLQNIEGSEEVEYDETDVDESQATQQLAQMSAEGNSLFLEVDKFEKVKNLVREMRNLSHEMGTVMDELDERNNQAGGTEQEAQSLLNEFAERRDELERAVSDES